jgi:2-oxoglutarate ferredoxin oxidoreductase subunit beta
MKRTFAELNLQPKDIAVISGIGCSSRTPYYLSTWGFNTIHGRAGAIASGLKIARPDLSVWQCTGDGDCLAIGGNHFIHEVRRNVDVNIVLFNNKIYGLTKGQYSPTTPQGQVTKTSPFGTIEEPFNVGELVIASKGTFFARCLDKNMKENVEIFKQAYNHKGTSVIECLVNCLVWNDGAHKNIETVSFKDGDKFEMAGVEFIYDTHDKDLANLVLDGVDAVSLTNVTSLGLYPVKAVKETVKIIKATEEHALEVLPKGSHPMKKCCKNKDSFEFPLDDAVANAVNAAIVYANSLVGGAQ